MKKSLQGLMQQLEVKLKRLQKAKPFTFGKMPAHLPKSGIYMMSEGRKVLYVGRSRSIRKRLQNHLRSGHNQATFAFLLARIDSGSLKASYKAIGCRQHLLNTPKFKKCFDRARNRIRNMKIRVIEETDPTLQALLEICVAHITKAKHNDFDTH